ncbi:hypothetical protein F5I97DRAFT_17360 [Phlebopus sp. FC_14]|nr:hypothetical protein F5I97DRAFT_17360 [Phlebopus sp. FC_14]
MSAFRGDSLGVRLPTTRLMACDQQIFARPPIYELVFAPLSPRSLVRVALTCRAAYQAAAAFKQRAFNVNRHLSQYFSDPLAFRSLQAKTGTLISGSNALQFLDRSFYLGSDLDVYTHPGHTFEVCRWLVESEGYHFVPRGIQDKDWREEIKDNWDGTQRRIIRVEEVAEDVEYPLSGIEGVYTFKKHPNAEGSNQDSRIVQVIGCKSSPFDAIINFHSTCVMNFIAFNAAYSLYPLATFEHRSSFAMSKTRNSITTDNAFAKYSQRGWHFYFAPRPRDVAGRHCTPFMFGATRWVGDNYTWTLPLDTTGIMARPATNTSSEPFPWDPVVYNSWSLRTKYGGLETKCDYFPLQTTVFRYNYCFSDEDLVMKLRHWAAVQGYASHRKLSKNHWSWFDADIPSFILSKN